MRINLPTLLIFNWCFIYHHIVKIIIFLSFYLASFDICIAWFILLKLLCIFVIFTFICIILKCLLKFFIFEIFHWGLFFIRINWSIISRRFSLKIDGFLTIKRTIYQWGGREVYFVIILKICVFWFNLWQISEQDDLLPI